MDSSQDLVRALKSSSDPPIQGGLYKVEIAEQAWEDASFYVPRKDQVISDWLLTTLLKDKAKDPSVYTVCFFPIVDLLLI